MDGVSKHTTATALNVVIVSLSPAKFVATVTSHTVSTELLAGLPYQDSITLTTTSGVHRDPDYIGEVQYIFRPNTQSKFTVGLTSLSESTSHGNMDLYISSTTNSQRSWTTAESVASHLDSSLVITPQAHEEFNIVVKFEPATVFHANTSGTTNTIPHILGGSVSDTFAFSVLASANTDLQRPVQLLGGYAQEGISDTVVSAETPLYYKLHVPEGREDVIITLDSVIGDSDLYVNPSNAHSGTSGSCFYVPSDASSTLPLWYSHTATGLDAVVITPGNGASATGGYYCITVFAHGFSRFRVRGYTSSTVITLTEGVTIYDHISEGTYHYYRFTDLQQEPIHSLVFDASPITGDSDLYVACDVIPTGDDSGYPSKQALHSNYSSSSYSEDVVTVSPLASNPKSCLALRGSNTYFLAVYGFTDTVVQVAVAHTNSIKTLTEGIPLNDQTVYKDTKQFFRIWLGFETEEITITTTPMSGDVDLFASYDSTFDMYTAHWASMKYGSDADSVTITEAEQSAAEGCHNCWLYVMVYGFATSQYTIVYTLSDTTVLLTNGLPLLGSVGSDEIEYYTIQLPTVDNRTHYYTVTAVATVFAGAPKLFISSGDVTAPNRTTVHTVSFDDDASGTLPIATIGIPGRDATQGLDSSYNNVYIGVGGDHRNSTYSVRAYITDIDLSSTGTTGIPEANDDLSTDSQHPVLLRLLDGIPQNDAIRYSSLPGRSVWKYYQVLVFAGHEDISVRVTTVIGEVDIYVSKCPYQSYECAGTRGVGAEAVAGHQSFLPDTSAFVKTSAGMDFDFLTIERNDEASCSYIIGIYSTNIFSQYQISVSIANSVLALQPGVSVSDHVEEHTYDFFSFSFASSALATADQDDDSTHVAGSPRLQITVTPIFGDPDIYISTTNTHPLAKGNETYWYGYQYGSDTVVIDPFHTDPSGNAHECVECTYYISVYGSREAAYTLTASITHSQDSTIVHLTDGVPATGIVLALGWNYYVYYFNYDNQMADRDLKVVLASLSGDADVYVNVGTSKKTSVNSSGYTSLPSLSNFDYTSGDSGSGDDVVVVSHLDDEYSAVCKAEGYCLLRIGVFGFQESRYSLTVTTSVSSTLLLMDMAHSGEVRAAALDLYRVMLSSNDTSTSSHKDGVRLTVTPYSGHVVVYARCKIATDTSIKVVPSSETAMWTLTVTDSDSSLDIYYLDAAEHGCLPSGQEHDHDHEQLEIAIAVENVGIGSSATYSVLASLIGSHDADSMPILRVGQPLSVDMPSQAMKYYMVQLDKDDLSSDLTVKFTVSAGSIKGYASNSWTGRPVLNSGNGHVSSYMYSTTARSSIGGNTENIKITHRELQSRVCGSIDAVAEGNMCYLIIGVVGTYNSGSTGSGQGDLDNNHFSMTVSYSDSTVTLQSGVPVSSSVQAKEYEYYKYSITIPHVDVVISVTPISGDPDLFIALKPNYHPTKFAQFQWSSSSLGADSLTIQAGDIRQKGCNVASDGVCDFYIGVYGWRNASYSIVAHMNEGFLNPLTLVDGQPQTGHVALNEYMYYKYFVTSDSGVNIPQSLRFSLSSADADGDQDMYITFADRDSGQSSTSRLMVADTVNFDDDIPAGTGGNSGGTGGTVVHNQLEPGKDNFDYKSTSYSGVMDEIVVSSDMPHYCVNCMVYVGVYGYTAGAYTITASASGLAGTLLWGVPTGGHVGTGDYNYYVIYNTDPLGVIVISLTTLVGDADIYVTAHKKSDTGAVTFPTADTVSGGHSGSGSTSMWKSQFMGDDSVVIKYTDPHFCSDCDYIIGVYGFRNSTYTLLVTEAEDTVIDLVMNRPQIATISWTGDASSGNHKDLRYFKLKLDFDMEDFTVSLTPLDTGVGDMFLQCYNMDTEGFNATSGARLPDPQVTESYLLSTEGSIDNLINIPHTLTAEFGENVQCVIAVRAYSSEMRFSIVASSTREVGGDGDLSNDKLIILQPGIPQDHYVSKGYTELFRYYPSRGEDVHITLTARNGDPDLIATVGPNDNDHSGTFKYPNCHFDAVNPYLRKCTGSVTWSSGQYSTDHMIISHDLPCAAIVPSTTVYNEVCNSATINYGQDIPIVIGVFGFTASKFTIMVVPTGQHVTLVPGRPQIGSTSTSFICSYRNSATGACTVSKSSIYREVESAYFTFQVNPTASGSSVLGADDDSVVYGSANGNTVVFSVVEHCQAVSSGSAVPSGTVGSDDDAETLTNNCNTNPLNLIINSCPKSKCSVYNLYPSVLVDQHNAKLTLDSGGAGGAISSATMFLMRDPLNEFSTDDTSGNGYCDPDKAGEPCIYYIAVDAPVVTSHSISSNDDAARPHAVQVAGREFSITARTPGDTTMIQCDDLSTSLLDPASKSAVYDGVRTTTTETIPLTSGGASDTLPRKYYEVCINNDYGMSHSGHAYGGSDNKYDGMWVSLEQCAGQTSIYACSDDEANQQCHALLPTPKSWSYYSDNREFCSVSPGHEGGANSPPLKRCGDVASQTDGSATPFTTAPVPMMQLPMSTPSADHSTPTPVNTYYLMAEGGGEYVLHMHYTRNQHILNPTLALASGASLTASTVRIKSSKDTTIMLQWDPMGVLMPPVGSADAGQLYRAAELYYMLYVTDMTALAEASDDDRSGAGLSLEDTYITTTYCGLNHMAESPVAAQHVKIIRVLSRPHRRASSSTGHSSSSVEHTLEGLISGHKYHIVVTAHCDGNCLKQVSKTVASGNQNGNDDPVVCGSSNLPCQAQVTLYPQVVAETGSGDSWDWSGSGTSWTPSVSVLITVTVVVIVIVVVLLLALGYYRNKLWMSRNRGFEALDTIDRRHQPNSSAKNNASGGGSSSIGNAIRNTASSVKSAVGKMNPMKGQYTPPSLGGASTYSPLNSSQQDEDDDVVETPL